MSRAGRISLVLVLACLFFPSPASARQNDRPGQKSGKMPRNSDIENIGTRDINKGTLNFMSYEDEIEMGRQQAAQMDRRVTLIDDPSINEYVNRLVQNLVRNSDARVPFTIKVIESDQVNAFALPGGFLYLNSGLILAADDEAELAAVMAHEIAHVTARHTAKSQSRETLLSIVTIPLIVVGGPLGIAIRQFTHMMAPVQYYSFSRKRELEADYLGLQYVYKTGYDPAAAIPFFKRLEAKETRRPGTMSKLFATHPLTGRRVVIEKENIERFLPNRDRYLVTTSDFNRVKKRLILIENSRRSYDEDGKPILKRKTAADLPRSWQ